MYGMENSNAIVYEASELMEEVIAGWSTYFRLIVQLFKEAERQYGIANLQYACHIVEHFEVAFQTCIMHPESSTCGLMLTLPTQHADCNNSKSVELRV